MKITKRQLRRIIKEEQTRIVNEALPQFQKNARAAGASYSSQRAPSPVSKKVGDLDVVSGAFKGTSTDRARLKKELTSQVEKIKASGKEDTLPANVSMILARSDGDQLAALQKYINPGMFKKLGKLFGLSEGTVRITRLQLRRIIKEEKARLTRSKLLKEALSDFEVMDELEAISEMAGKLLSALENGGIETPDMGGLTAEQQELMNRPLENIRYEITELLNQLTEV